MLLDQSQIFFSISISDRFRSVQNFSNKIFPTFFKGFFNLTWKKSHLNGKFTKKNKKKSITQINQFKSKNKNPTNQNNLFSANVHNEQNFITALFNSI
jgi:hypothetical protein